MKHFFQIDLLIGGSVFRPCLDPGDADRSQHKEDSQIVEKLPKIHKKKYIPLQGLSIDADKLRVDAESLPFSLDSQRQHYLSGIHESTCHGPNTSCSSSSAFAYASAKVEHAVVVSPGYFYFNEARYLVRAVIVHQGSSLRSGLYSMHVHLLDVSRSMWIDCKEDCFYDANDRLPVSSTLISRIWEANTSLRAHFCA